MRTRQTIHAAVIERHMHAEPYAALVLAGGYEEAGDNGRFRVQAGDVLFHDGFEAHRNLLGRKGARVLNLRLSGNEGLVGMARLADADTIARLAERDRRAALDLLLAQARRRDAIHHDWPDELAGQLLHSPGLRLGEWGAERGLSPWTLTRGFTQIYGVAPETFRARARARRAWKWIRTTHLPLAAIAARLGFADQAHMTRGVRQLTGLTPQAWRASANGFKTTGHGPG